MAAPTGGTPLPIVEWALGPIGRQIDAIWIHTPAADSLKAVMVRLDTCVAASDAKATPAKLLELRLVGGPAADTLEREYAALYEPLREARSRAVKFCVDVDEAPTLRDVDWRKARRVEADAVAAALELDAAMVAAGLSACESTLASAAPIGAALLEAYGELDFTPARMDARLRTLQRSGTLATATTLPREDEYGAMFQPVRQFWQRVRDALAGAGATGGAGTGAAPAGSIAAAIGRFRGTLKDEDAEAFNAAAGDVCRILTPALFFDTTVVRVVAVALHAHASRPAVVERACARLEAAIDFVERDKYMASTMAGSITALLAALVAQAGNASSIAAIAGPLYSLTWPHENRRLVAAAGAIPLLVAAMTKHVDSEAVFVEVCSLLRLLADDDSHASGISAAGGVAPLLEALSRQAGARDVVEEACCMLQVLAAQRDIQAAIAAAGGTARLVTALIAHADDEGIAKGACGALCHLSSDEDTAAAIVAAGAIVPLVGAVLRHAGCSAVAQQAAGTLYRLACKADNLTMIVEAGGIPAIVSAIEASTAATSAARAAAPAATAVSTAASALAARAADAKAAAAATAAEQCCLLLDKLASADTARSAIVAAGGVMALEAAVAVHTGCTTDVAAAIIAAATHALAVLHR